MSLIERLELHQEKQNTLELITIAGAANEIVSG